MLLAFAAMLAATDVRAQIAGLGDVSATSDADDFGALRIRAGALFDYQSPYHYIGAAAQTTHYTQSGWTEDAPAAFLLWRRQNRDTLAGTVGEVGVVRVSDKVRLIGDANWTFRPSPRTGIELLAAGGLVETQPAVEEAIAYQFGGVSLERELSRRFTAIGLAGVQHFTDGNDRVHLRGRLIYTVIPEHGISLQARWRQFESSELDVDGAYFNPEHYSEWQGGVVMRKRYAGWIWSGTLAAGRETIDRNIEQTTKLADFRGEGMIGRSRLTVYASYNRSAGFGTTDDYWHRVVGAMITVPF